MANKNKSKITFSCLHGNKYWFKGKYEKRICYHREDGPAIESISGTKYWFKNGELHYDKGPAVVFANGDLEYWLNGIKISKKHWLKTK